MIIKCCPKCGRIPKIHEAIPFKNGTRRRFIGCPNYCYVLKPQTNKGFFSNFLGDYSCLFIGEGDDNQIYKMWNENLK